MASMYQIKDEIMKTYVDLDIGELPEIRCSYHSRNAECRGTLCPYHAEEDEESQ